MTAPQTKFVNGKNPFQTAEAATRSFETRVLEHVKRHPLSKASDVAACFGTNQQKYVERALREMRRKGIVDYVQQYVKGGAAYLYSVN